MKKPQEAKQFEIVSSGRCTAEGSRAMLQFSSILETRRLRHLYEDVQDAQVLHCCLFLSLFISLKAMRHEFAAHAGCWDHAPATQDYGMDSTDAAGMAHQRRKRH